MNACAPLDGTGLVAPLLEQVDCQVAAYVETAYDAMFGPFGFLEPALTGALTIYIAIYGFQLIMGRSGLALSGLAPKVLALGLVLAFATRWGAYQAVFLNLFYGGADHLASMLLSGGDSVFMRLDNILRELIRLASEWNDTAINRASELANGLPPQPVETPLPSKSNGIVNLLWFSAILLALSTAGVLIIAKIVLGLLLALGPALVVTALFAATRGLFEGWLKTLANYALVAAFAMALAVFGLHAGFGLPLPAALFCGGAGWAVSYAARSYLGHLLAKPLARVRVLVSGAPLDKTPQQIIDDLAHKLSPEGRR